MARTKETPRKSQGGRKPTKRLANKAAHFSARSIGGISNITSCPLPSSASPPRPNPFLKGRAGLRSRRPPPEEEAEAEAEAEEEKSLSGGSSPSSDGEAMADVDGPSPSVEDPSPVASDEVGPGEVSLPPLVSLENSANHRTRPDVLPPGTLRVTWGHDVATSILYRQVVTSSLSGGRTISLEGTKASRFSTRDKVRLAVLYAGQPKELQFQPICLVCRSPQVVVSCNGEHPSCSGPSLCGEHYSLAQYGRNAFSGMEHEGNSYTLNVCEKLRSMRAEVFPSLPPNQPLPLERYVVNPLIIVTVDCFDAKEGNRSTARAAMDNFFDVNNLVQGFGVLHFEVRGHTAPLLLKKFAELRSVLASLFTEAPLWQGVPVVVFFNVHFDGIAFFRIGQTGRMADASTLRTLFHKLYDALCFPPRPSPTAKFFLNTCGVGRATVRTIAQPSDLPDLRIDIASFEELLLVERVYSNYSLYLSNEVFNFNSFKGRGGPASLASFATVFKRCFAQTDLEQLMPTFCEFINGQPHVWSFGDYQREVEYLSTVHSSSPPVPPILPSRSLRLANCGEALPPPLPFPPISWSVGSTEPSVDQTESLTCGSSEERAKTATKRAPVTVAVLLEREKQRGSSHKDRSVLALKVLRETGIVTDSTPPATLSATLQSLLAQINAERAKKGESLFSKLSEIYNKK